MNLIDKEINKRVKTTSSFKDIENRIEVYKYINNDKKTNKFLLLFKAKITLNIILFIMTSICIYVTLKIPNNIIEKLVVKEEGIEVINTLNYLDTSSSLEIYPNLLAFGYKTDKTCFNKNEVEIAFLAGHLDWNTFEIYDSSERYNDLKEELLSYESFKAYEKRVLEDYLTSFARKEESKAQILLNEYEQILEKSDEQVRYESFVEWRTNLIEDMIDVTSKVNKYHEFYHALEISILEPTNIIELENISTLNTSDLEKIITINDFYRDYAIKYDRETITSLQNYQVFTDMIFNNTIEYKIDSKYFDKDQGQLIFCADIQTLKHRRIAVLYYAKDDDGKVFLSEKSIEDAETKISNFNQAGTLKKEILIPKSDTITITGKVLYCFSEELTKNVNGIKVEIWNMKRPTHKDSIKPEVNNILLASGYTNDEGKYKITFKDNRSLEGEDYDIRVKVLAESKYAEITSTRAIDEPGNTYYIEGYLPTSQYLHEFAFSLEPLIITKGEHTEVNLANLVINDYIHNEKLKEQNHGKLSTNTLACYYSFEMIDIFNKIGSESKEKQDIPIEKIRVSFSPDIYSNIKTQFATYKRSVYGDTFLEERLTIYVNMNDYNNLENITKAYNEYVTYFLLKNKNLN